MSRFAKCFALVGLLMLPTGLAAQEELILEGNRLYQENDFPAALEAYQRVYDSGFEAADLHYNIANSYFKLGDLARAILFYERALDLSPGDADILANLELARSLTVDDIDPLPRFWLLQAWDWWVGLLPRGMLLWVVGGGWVLGGLGVAASLLGRDPWAGVGRRVAVVGGIVCVVFGLNLVIREAGLGQPERAVVMAPETEAQSAPSDDPNLTLFNIHEGTTVRVERRSDGWAEILLADGRVGWIRTEAIETI